MHCQKQPRADMLRAMRWAASLFALGLVMALVHRVTAPPFTPLGGRAALAFGLLVVAALVGADLARRARLPRVTGFVVLGFLVGPGWLGLIRADELRALAFMGNAALTLIAFEIGRSLHIHLAPAGRVQLARLALGTTLFPVVAVSLVAISVSHWLPLTVHQPFSSGLAASLALGAVAGISSATLTFGVLAESGDSPELGQSILHLSVLKDVAGVVLLVAVLVVARVASARGVVDARVALETTSRLLASLAVGLGLGALTVRYTSARFGGVAVLAALALAGGFLARERAIDFFVGLAAGMWILTRGTNETQAELDRGWGMLALPAYGVAFTLLGAGLRVDALADVWPWALLLAGVRAVTLRYGALWGGRDSSREFTEAVWLGLLSQGGTALLLASVARRAFPGWGVSFEALVAAMVVFHALLGPLALRYALAASGEPPGSAAIAALNAAEPPPRLDPVPVA